MITIYSADSEGKLFTDPKQHFYIDGEILRDRATYTRTNYLLNQIAIRAGFENYSAMVTNLRCSGVTNDVMESWIFSGKLIENVKMIRA